MISREELAQIKKRHAKAEEDEQPGWHEAHAAEAHEDRDVLLAALEATEARVAELDEIRRALGPYALVPPDGGAEPTSDLVRNLVTRVSELEVALLLLERFATDALVLAPNDSNPTYWFLAAIHRHAKSALATAPRLTEEKNGRPVT